MVRSGDLLRSPARRAIAVFILVLAVYVAGLAPGVLWGDQAQFQREAATLSLSLRIRGYPLYRLLTWAIGALPFGALAVKVNLVSAVSAAGAVALSYHLLERLLVSRLGALLGAAALTFSHGFWTVAEIAEVYAPHLLIVALFAWLLTRAGPFTRRRLALAGAVALLGWLHHRIFALCVPPALVLLFLRRKDLSGLPGRALSSLALLVPLCLPPIVLFAIDPSTAATVRTGGAGLVARIAYFSKFLVLDFPSPALVLGIVGALSALRRWREPPFAFLASSFLVALGVPFVLSWHGDQHVFFLPAFYFFALLAGVGADALFADRRRLLVLTTAATALLPIAVYTAAATWLARDGAPDPLGVPRVYYRSFLLPPRFGLDDPRRFAESVLDYLPPDSHLLTGWGEGNAILYLKQVEGRRPDVEVKIIRGAGALKRQIETAGRPVYLTRFPHLPRPRAKDALPRGYRAERDGPVFRIVPD